MVRARELGIASNITFTGPQPYSLMPGFLSVADIGLSLRTSTFTGNMTFPTKLTTYMAAGLPSIATKTGDQRRILSKNDVGYLVESGNPEDLGKKILEAFSYEKRLERQGKEARRVAEEEFSWDVLCEKYIRIYKDVLG